MNDRDASDRVKIQTAKSAILAQVQELPEGARVELRTYPAQGGIESNGCPGISPPRNNSGWNGPVVSQIGVALASLPKPDGGTPTGEALIQAADQLKADGRTSVAIVLISDGESNCGRDSCEAAKELKSRGVDAIVDTVGFDIATSGRAQLECIASAGGGKYADAADSEKLSLALRDQLGSTLKVEAVAPTTVTPLGGPFNVSAKITANGLQAIRDVSVSVADKDPASDSFAVRPTVRIGNLAPGQTRVVQWQIWPPGALRDRSSFQIVATAASADRATKDFEVSYARANPGTAGLSAALKGFGNVLVLGDSYSAGEGAGTTDRPYYADPKTQAVACHRTKNQYASWLYSPDQVGILACSGATTDNLDQHGQHGENTQLAQLSARLEAGYRPDVIMISITGNDIGFPDIAYSCATDKVIGLNLTGCWADPSSIEYSATSTLLHAVPDMIINTVTSVRHTFKNAGVDTPPILVVPYPRLFGGIARGCSSKWRTQNLAFAGHLHQLANLQDLLNGKIEQGTQGLPGVYFVADVIDAVPPQHNACSDDPWFVPVTLSNSLSGSPERLHPTVEGQQAMAAAINRWAAQHEQPLAGSNPSAARSDWRQFAFDASLSTSHVGIDLRNTDPGRTGSFDYGSQTLTITGGQPNSTTTLFLQSRTLPLGQVRLDAQGKGTLHLRLQATDIPPGDHVLNVLGFRDNGESVLARVPVRFNNPFPVLLWILVGVGLLAFAGAVVSAIRLRKHPR